MKIGSRTPTLHFELNIPPSKQKRHFPLKLCLIGRRPSPHSKLHNQNYSYTQCKTESSSSSFPHNADDTYNLGLCKMLSYATYKVFRFLPYPYFPNLTNRKKKTFCQFLQPPEKADKMHRSPESSLIEN